ncbi:MAG: hypothetical protein WDO15_14355 [Bacteroidota bacterium]
MTQHTFKIKTPAEFSYEFSLGFLTRSAKEVMHVVNDRTVKKLLKIDGELVLFSVFEGNGHLHVEVSNKDHSEKIESYVKEWFDLDADLSKFYTPSQRKIPFSNRSSGNFTDTGSWVSPTSLSH